MGARSNLDCAKCGTLSCKSEPGEKTPPSFCPMREYEQALHDVRTVRLRQPETRHFAAEAARTEAAGYCKETRVEEIMSFACRIGANHLGIACCVGTLNEARLAQKIFVANGFVVSTVACKVGSIPKEELGLTEDEKIRPGQFEPLCNPIAQAELLAKAETQLNVVIGLCVGHDSLFFQHSKAPVTVLMVKDRVTGHNPAAALYTSSTYYRKLKHLRNS